MDPRDFHSLAERLAAGSSAAEFRTSVGRAYYAVFNVGAEALREMGFPVGKGAAAHGEVRNCLHNSGDATVAAAASEIGLLHTLRNRADYQLDRKDSEKRSDAIRVAETAGDLIRTIDTAFAGPTRAALRAAIAKWRHENGYP